MTEPNVIDNPLFEKDSNSVHCTEVNFVDDQSLIGPVMNPVKNFAQGFSKEGIFYKLKIAIWVLILFLAISETVTIVGYVPLLESWSRWYSKVNVPLIGFEYKQHSIRYMANLTWIWLLATTFSLVMHFLKRKNVDKYKMFLSCLAVMDTCISTFFFLNILRIFLSYLNRTLTEYLWFYPRLMNGTSVDKFTEYEAYRPPEPRYNYDDEYRETWYRRFGYSTTPSTTTIPGSTTFSPDDIKTMETRRNAIITRLIVDPIVMILALLLILLNIVYVWRIRSAIKRTNLWESDYKKLYPQCSKLDAGYAKFWPIGLLKVINCILPVFLCLGPFNDFTSSRNTVMFKLSTACCFGIFFYRWISYIKTVRFRNQNLNGASNKGLGSSVKLDSFIYFLGFTFYLVWLIVIHSEAIQIACLLALFLLLCSFSANIRLLHKYNGFRFQAPCVSVNVSIKVNKEKISIERIDDLDHAEEKKLKEKQFCAHI